MLPHANSYRVAERFLAGEYPFPTAADVERLNWYVAAGVTCFIDLTAPGEAWDYATALPPTIAHLRFPIPDFGVPESPAVMQAILAAIDQAREQGATVYLHCRGGIGRTGMVVGCWLVRHGATGDAALATVARLWQTVAKAARYPHSPETPAQEAYARAWATLQPTPVAHRQME
ncbi:protein-tyrosine phosphatase family protein [Chloroflexus sp.]|uniref:protein-tyrosine phosphatase family protein n=1 Tax=Chloroflexus sp. TaxID=1904827 RepID=UPI0026349DAD|nr:protein-tyrosine phosphatase family protein [uncultured Chloroflexus sp.]